MPDAALARARLVAQGLITRPYETPADGVTAFGAMQGQELAGVLASAALRTKSGTIEPVLDDLKAGRLVRGYPMRGTVFLMPGDDVTWITELCAGPSLRAAANRRHQLDLEHSDVDRALTVASQFLSDKPKRRVELNQAWEDAGLSTQGGRGYHLLFTLIAGGHLVHGPWNGSEQDIALVSQWLPNNPTLASRFNSDRIAAVAEFLRRYLITHGPATIRDFAWWSKLTLTEIRAAIAHIADQFESDGAREPMYWRPGLWDEVASLGRKVSTPLLLPGFDEFILGYGDRLFAMTDDHHHRLVPGNNGVFMHSVIAGGLVRGTWKWPGRKLPQRELIVEEFTPLSATARREVERAYARFPFPARVND